MDMQEIIKFCFFLPPPSTVELVTASLPDEYAHRTLQHVAKQLGASHHVEFYLRWACCLLAAHGPKEDVLSHHSLLVLHQNLNRKYETLSRVCDFNKYTLKVLLAMAESVPKDDQMQNTDDEDELDLVLVRQSNNGTNGHISDDSDSTSSEENSE